MRLKLTLLWILLCAVSVRAQNLDGANSLGQLPLPGGMLGPVPFTLAVVSPAIINSFTNAGGTTTMNCNIATCGVSTGQGIVLGIFVPVACQGLQTITSTAGNTASFASASCSGVGPYTTQIGQQTCTIESQNQIDVGATFTGLCLFALYDGDQQFYTYSAGVQESLFDLDVTGRAEIANVGTATGLGLMYGGSSIPGGACFGAITDFNSSTCNGIEWDSANTGTFFRGNVARYHGINNNTAFGHGFMFQLFGGSVGTVAAPSTFNGSSAFFTTQASGYGSGWQTVSRNGKYDIHAHAQVVTATGGGVYTYSVSCPFGTGTATHSGPAAAAFATVGAVYDAWLTLVCNAGAAITETVTNPSAVPHILDVDVYID